MAHTNTLRNLVRLIRKAYSRNREADVMQVTHITAQQRQSRRRFLQGTAALSATGILSNALPGAIAAAKKGDTRIAIVGAGLAGLNAAYQLKKLGIRAEVYEASTRLGGRVFSQTGTVTDGLTLEYGAELINTDHADMLALVQDFGLTLFDRRADTAHVTMPAAAYFFKGKSWPETELVELLRPFVDRISKDAELININWNKYAPEFDRMSVADYLDKHTALIPDPVVRELFEGAIRVEYGAEPSESTALQLLFLLPNIDNTHLELLGYSDEAYAVKGGNSQIVAGLANVLSGQIHTGMLLTGIGADKPDGYQLSFKNGEHVEADIVIIAIPFTLLRNVDIDITLPKKLRDFIQQVNLGRNEKVLAGFSERVWRQSAFSLEAWTDLGSAEVWDGAQSATERTDGVLTYYLGANEVDTLNNSGEEISKFGSEFTQRLGKFVPLLADKATGKYLRTGWTRNPFSLGAYVNYQPGQLTNFGQYFWIESDDPAERQVVHVGRLIFAGEHLSDEYYGFMNGAAQTGRLAAQLATQLMQKNLQRPNEM